MTLIDFVCVIVYIYTGNTSVHSENITCPDQFLKDNKNSCQPKCDEFTQFSEHLTTVYLTVPMVAALFALLSSAAVIVSIAVSNRSK